MRHVYAELEAIHSKLQRESAALAERAVRAAEREGRLAAREEEVAVRHGGALNKLREVQAQVQGTLHALRQQHAAEVQELSEALREKSRENKRIKASFDTLKDMNDSLKKQMSELTEQNKRLETQAHRVQQRLENLQRKFDFQRAQKGRTVLLTQAHNGQLRRALEKPDKQPPPQPHKVKASVGLCELLGLLLLWVPDLHPSPDPNVALSLPSPEPALEFPNKREHQQNTRTNVKALPLVVEQLSSVPSVSKRLQLPLVNFVLWALGRMDGTSQHATLTATCRRLGEELFKPGGSTRGAEGSAESSPEPKPHMGGSFFRSSEPEVRLLSSLVILRTLSQADVLAQVLDSVCSDLQSEQSKRLFVRHGGVAVVTALLTSPCRGLLGDAVGVLLLLAMSIDSGCVEEFLAACSTEVWFRSCSQLLRTPHLDPLIPEKMSVILQKLSKIKTNRRLFEACSLHIQLQEMLRTAEPHQVFLAVNLRSTLHQLVQCFKCEVLISSRAH
uniref:Coiled-coil domain containing 138 n=1 Tax=Petromyzon marinus TaxID=7757 RepID=S4RTY3_PETMA